MNTEQRIFKKGSTTYYFSSWFFPPAIRQDVFKLYSFVRIADNYVDEQPAQPQKLLDLEQRYYQVLQDKVITTPVKRLSDLDERVVKNIVDVSRAYQFDPAWMTAFFASMKADITPQACSTLADTLTYIHGSAEVIGLMMARILGLPPQADHAAIMQGRAMQYINFIRDIDEDNMLGRCYFPQDELRAAGLADLTAATAAAQPQQFAEFVRQQIARYQQWQQDAQTGFAYIPRRYRIPVRTAADMYQWTAERIAKNPAIIFQQKVKPTKWRVMRQAATRMLHG